MFFLHFILGLVTAYIGSIPPSMLNVSATKISIEKNKKTAKRFAMGVSSVVFIQAFLALFFLNIINENPLILEYIKITSIVIFFLLSIVFLYKAIKEQKEDTSNLKVKNGFISGVGLSFLNMFAIPFYCGIGALFNLQGWLSLDLVSVILFVLGAVLGTYLILSHYILLAEKIKQHLVKFTKYLNYVLSAITGFVAIFSLFKML